MYLAAYLKAKRKDVEIKLIDMRVHSESVLKSILKEYNPDIAGISAITIEEGSMKKIAELIKARNNNCIVIAGGPHPTAFSEEVLAYHNIDYIVRGEGEETFFELLNTIIDGGDIHKVKGIGYKEDKSNFFTENRGVIKDVDSIPMPAWDYINTEEYFRRTSMSNYGIRRYANLYTSRACPYRCIYCHNIFGKGFRGRSPENVIEEIKYLKTKYNIEEVEVIDDVFNFDRDRAIKIFELTQKETPGLKYSFPNGLRGDRLDVDLLKVMKRAGTVMLTIAVESADEKIQKFIKKHLNLEKTLQAIEDCDNANILTRGFFMLGFPDETEEEVIRTINYALHSKLHIAMFYITIPFKGTELYNYVTDRINSAHYSPADYEYVGSRFNLSRVSSEMLKRLQTIAYIKFYSNPWRWWRIFRLSPYRKDLVRYLPDLLLRFNLDRQVKR
jgi:radical SAM superfamily enzyme YgiQ (UPF0313 family)